MAEDKTVQSDEPQMWPLWVLIGFIVLIGLVIISVSVYFLIRFLKKRKRRNLPLYSDDDSTLPELSSIIIGPSVDSSIAEKSQQDTSILSINENSQIDNQEGEAESPKIAVVAAQPKIEDAHQKVEKIPESKKQVAATQMLQEPDLKTAVEAPTVPAAATMVVEKKNAATVSKEEANSKEILSKESVKEVSEGGNKKEEQQQDKVIKSDEKVKDGSDGEAKKKDGLKVEDGEKKKKKRDFKKLQKEKSLHQIETTSKTAKKKQKKRQKRATSIDSKESTSDPPNSLNIYVKSVKAKKPSFVSRNELPAASSTKSASIWSVLRHSVGKDLSRVTVPIHFNEPLSYLQRLAEYMEYISLVKDAAEASDPVQRLELIAAFALSNVSSNNVRLSKPFNPLLFETYELSKPELGFKFVAEQVSHHPPISAFHSEGDDFEFYGNIEPQIKFWGRSLEDTPKAFFTLFLKNLNETYTWNAASFSLHNLIMGKMYMSLTGVVVVKCLENNLQAKVKFRGANKQAADTLLIGEVFQGKEQIRTIYGNWTQYLASTTFEKFVDFKMQWEKEYRIVEKHKNFDLITLFPESRILWRVNKKPPNSKENYNFTYFALLLNEMMPDSSMLPKTDVRFRPDIRQMEEGNLDLASEEKERLEAKQRAKAKEREGPPEPHWFSQGNDKRSGKKDGFMFNEKYWSREYAICEDIY